jgi:hypothetical protein
MWKGVGGRQQTVGTTLFLKHSLQLALGYVSYKKIFTISVQMILTIM